MNFLSKKSIVGAILSAIVLGAIGSGVWQYILDPIVSSGSRLMLNLATLGMESFKNDLYQEIAKGFHEKASYALYAQFNTIFSLAFIGFAIILALKTKELIQRKSEMMEELLRIEDKRKQEPLSIAEIESRLKNTKPERLLKFIYILLGICLVLMSAQYVNTKRDSYINSAITHYFQLKKIVSPHVSQVDLMNMDSRFSQIQSAKSYEVLITEMSTIAKQNAANTPAFEVWN